MASDPHNLAGVPSQEEGLHPSSDLAKFFPNLVQGNTQPVARSPPPIHPSPNSPHHPHMYHHQLPYPPSNSPINPAGPPNAYYSNMYLAQQKHYPNPASPPPFPPAMYTDSSIIPPYHSPLPSHNPLPSHSPVPYHSPMPSHSPVPPHLVAPSPSAVSSNASPSPSPAPSTTPHSPSIPPSSTAAESKPKAKKEKIIGTRLTGARNTYQLDMASTGPRRQLEATPITIYNSSGDYIPASLIAANNNYICYAIKGDMVRVLSRHAQSRDLLRGHTESIVELSFSPSPSSLSPSSSSSSSDESQPSAPVEAGDLLASTAKDGNIFLWRLDNPSSDPIVRALLLNLFSATKKNSGYFHRVSWHPTDCNVLAAVSSEPGGGIYIFNIPLLLTFANNKATSPQCDIDQLDQATGVRILRIPDATTIVQDIAFSPNGSLLAAGSDDGRVTVWDLQTNECIYNWLDNVEQQATGEQQNQSAISTVLFPCNSILVTSTHKNSTVHLWNLPQQASQQPVCLQSIVFTHKTKEFLGHLSFDPTGTFLFLASTSLCVGFILHLDAPRSASKDKDNRTYIPKFDYLTEFDVTQPILSFTVGIQTSAPQESQEGEEVPEKRESDLLQLFCIQTKAIQIHQTSTDQCYSTSKQTTDDDTPGPLTQIGRVGDHPSSEQEAHPVPLSSSAETRQVLERQTEEFNQQQQNLWLSHSVETRRDSYAPEEQYQDPAFSPLAAAPSAPTFPVSPQPNVLLEHPPEQTNEVHNEQEQHKETSQDHAQNLSQEEQPHDQTQPQEQVSQAQSQEEKSEPVDLEQPQQEEHAQENQQENSTINETENQVPVHQESAKEVHEHSLVDQEPQAGLSPKQEESQQAEVNDQENKQEQASSQEQDKPSADTTLQVAQSATPTAKAAKNRGGRNKKENSVHADQAATEAPQRHVPTSAPIPSNQPKQKSSAPITILHRNSPAQNEANVTRSVSPSTATPAPLVQEDLRKFEANMMSRMEKLFVQQLDKQYARLDKERLERERLEKERQERLLAVISQTLNSSIQQQLERIIKKELHTELEKLTRDVVQSVEGVVVRTVHDAVKKSNQGTGAKVDQRSMDGLFKEALDKAIPQMRSMIAESLRQPIQQSFVQYFQDKLIPAFDQSCKVMFAQLSSTFEDGIQNVIASQKTEISGSGGLSNSSNVLVDQLRVTVQTLLDVTSSMSSSIVQTQNKLLASHQGAPSQQSLAPIPSPNLNLTPSHSQPPPQPQPQLQLPHLPPHQSHSLHSQPAQSPPIVHSTTSYPGASEPHATLSKLVGMRRYEDAFDAALSLSNLGVVTWLCSIIGDPKLLFPSGTLQLSQPVLLSLVQQLGYDLDSEPMVKFLWLQAVVPFVDPKSPHVPEHQVRDVMNRLFAKLEETYPKYGDPSYPYSHAFKMLYHIVNTHRRNVFVYL